MESQGKLSGKKNAYGEITDEDEDDFDEEMDLKITEVQGKGKKIRQSVSAEVFGLHNKKKEFVPIVIHKSEETKERI